MAPLKPSSVTVRSSSSAAASGTAVGSAAKAAKRVGCVAIVAASRSLTPRVTATAISAGSFCAAGGAVREHLHVDLGLVHFLEA